MDRIAPAWCATQPVAQQRSRPDKETAYGEVSFLNLPFSTSFDHLVGDGEQLWGHSEAEHRGGLGVDDKLELARLHNRQVRGLLALEDAAGIGAGLAPRLCNVGSVTHQPAGIDKIARGI